MPGAFEKIPHWLSIIAASAMISASVLTPANAQFSAPLLRPIAQQDTTVTQDTFPVLRVSDRRRGDYRRGRRHHRRHNDGAAIIGGILGLTTGLIIGGSLNQRYYDDPYYGRGYRNYGPPPRGYYTPRSRTYYRPAQRRHYAPPPPVYRGRYAAWSPEWYAYCARKYRSFNPRTGYFLAYSGRYRFCH